jgi:cytochrome b561
MSDHQTKHWRLSQRLTHWLLAACVLGGGGLALYLLNPPNWSDAYIRRYESGIEVHKLLGIAALALALGLAALHGRRPARGGKLPARRGATIVQFGMLALTVAAAITGYLASSLFGGQIQLAGVILRSPLPYNEAWGSGLTTIHNVLTYALLAFVAAHVLAALWRHFVRRDTTLTAMVTGKSIEDRS